MGGNIMKFAHTTIYVRNMEESLKFYQEVLGLPVVRKIQAGPTMEIVFLGEGETLVELICDKNKSDVNMGQDISLGFVVESADEAMEEVKAKGIAIHSGPFQPNPATKYFFVLDPNGLKIQFIQH